MHLLQPPPKPKGGNLWGYNISEPVLMKKLLAYYSFESLLYASANHSNCQTQDYGGNMQKAVRESYCEPAVQFKRQWQTNDLIDRIGQKH